jgi:hypothetical protein
LAGTGSEVTGAIAKDAAGFKMTAAGAGSVAVGTDSAVIGDASGSAVATRALAVDETGAVVEDAVVEDAFAVVFAAEVGAAAAESEAGVEGEADVNPRPSFTGTGTRARADDPKKANNMAAMATLTSLPLT